MGSSKTSQKIETNKFFKEYTNKDMIKILVGKGARGNDQLTKQAKSNDYWFHAVVATGSHVVIPANQLKGKSLSEETKKQAAILAVHFSKLKKDYAGEVYFTRRHNLRKPKNAPPGLWLVTRSESIFIRYNDQDLQETLNNLSSH